MKINIQDIITLNDNREYVVVSKVLIQNKEYICIIDIIDHTNLKYAEIKKDHISIINKDEKELLEILIPLFYKNSYNKIN
jgi:hypothetical protein